MKNLKKLEKIITESLELYNDDIISLKCEDGFNHFIIFFENKYYLVYCESGCSLSIVMFFDTLFECENYYFEMYGYLN